MGNKRALSVALLLAVAGTARPEHAASQQPPAPATAPTTAPAPRRAPTVPLPAPRDLTVGFRGRRIDLQPYYEGFPYRSFRADYEAQRLMYFRDTRAGRELVTAPFSATTIDLDAGARLGTVDWNTRGMRMVEYHAPTHQWVLLADERNEERWNLYTMDERSGAMERLTNHEYIYGWSFDKQRRFAGYVPRHGTTIPYRSCVNLFDMGSHQDREVLCDSPEMTFTWTDVNFRPDGAGAVITALRQSDRNHQNLVYVDFLATPPSQRVLTDASVRRRNVGSTREWLDNNRFVYTSDESGFTNVYVYDLATNASRQVTSYREDVEDVVVLVEGEGDAARRALAVMIKRPYESELRILNPDTGAQLAQRVFDATVTFLDYRANHALLESNSRRSRFELNELTVTHAADGASATIELDPRAGLREEIARRIQQCDVERVSIPTFDTDRNTGHTRELHAFLQTPRNLPPAQRRLGLIESFYGGENVFDTTAQIYCDAGISVLSPSVRGSSGFGAEFAALNDRDLGGNEIIDDIYAARWLARRLGTQERNIGIYGGSHGGYAAMRAVTFPEEVNGRRERFDWGFGIAFYGFADIITFYQNCNIPDWVLLEAGDPRTERERLLDRSPITHAHRAVAPLLLLHGENDNRVPVTESRRMNEALQRARRRVRYVEFAGQGHGLKGLANQHRAWSEVLGFLAREVDGRGGAGAQASAPRSKRARYLLVGGALLAVLLAAGAYAARDRKEE